MKLHAQTYPNPDSEATPLVILHGLLGSSRNWINMARRLSGERPVWAIDLRNHGTSPHAETMAWEELVTDVTETLATLGHPQVDLMGHSLGGKVAMRLAIEAPEWVRRLIVVDIVPKVYPPYHSRDFEAMLSLPLSELSSRKAADERLAEAVPDWAHRQFLLTNVKRSSDGGLAWAIPLRVLHQQLETLRGDSLPTDVAPKQTTLIVRGGKSRFIDDEDEAAVGERFPDCRFEHLAESGHNPHFDCPDRFAETVEAFLPLRS